MNQEPITNRLLGELTNPVKASAAAQGDRAVRNPPPPPQTNIFVPQNTFTDVFDITCDIGNFRTYIFCPKTTQELPKKHQEAGV